MKKILSIFTAVLLCFTLCIPVFATDDSLCSVNYTNASEFLFNPNGGDLFNNFKGVMPGDELTQEIVLANQLATRTVTLYLRAEIDEEYKDFLDFIEIEVSLDREGSSERILAKNKASEPGNLARNISIGTYAPGERGLLTVKINVDKAMGNEFKNAVGVIDWIFSAEEGEEPPTEPPTTEPPTEKPSKPTTTPDTGSDDTVGIVFGAIAIVAVIAIGFIVFGKKKKNNNDDEPPFPAEGQYNGD